MKHRIREPQQHIAAVATALIAVLATASASAQSWFTEAQRGPLVAWSGLDPRATVGDFDADGSQEVFVFLGGDEFATYAESADGRFIPTHGTLTASYRVQTVASGDIDGDGDTDIVLGLDQSSQRLAVLRNDGAGGFSDHATGWAHSFHQSGASLQLFDADGDGDLDALTAGPLMLVNDGTGTFTDESSSRIPSDLMFGVDRTALLDIDDDGDVDVIVALAYGPLTGSVLALLNDGTGTFSLDPLRVAPAQGNDPVALATGDVDGDGDSDLVVASREEADRIYENLGGYLVPMQGTGLPLTAHDSCVLALEDFDGDGDLDVFFGTEWVGTPDRNHRVWRNAGDGTFTSETVPEMGDTPRSILTLPDPASGRHRVLIVGSFRAACVVDAGGRFIDPSGGDPVGPGGYLPDDRVLTAVDFDGDGRRDLLTGSQFDGPRVLYGRGFGAWVASPGTPNTAAPYRFAAGRVDGDGQLDLVAWGPNGVPGVVLSAAAGGFQPVSFGRFGSPQPTISNGSLVDIDGDGDDDFVCARWSSQLSIFVNDGSGQFADEATTRAPAAPPTNRVVAGDFDGDGDADLIVRDEPSGQPSFWQNDGTGRFTDATSGRFPAMADLGPGSPAFDYDGDGDLDLLRDGATGDTLLLNDGTGHFTSAPAPAGEQPLLDAGAKDIDGDGTQDLWVVTEAGELRVLRRIGPDTFDVDGLGAVTDPSVPPVFADLDGDGDADVFGTLRGTLLGLARQTRIVDTAVAGGDLLVRVHLRPGELASGWAAATFFALERAEFALPPWGTIGLRPDATVLLDQAPMAAPDGLVEISRPIPNAPSLIGVEFHLQSLVLHPSSGDALLTNVASEIIR